MDWEPRIRKKVERYLDDDDVSIRSLAEHVSVDHSLIAKWLKGNRPLGIVLAERLARYFGMKLKG